MISKTQKFAKFQTEKSKSPTTLYSEIIQLEVQFAQSLHNNAIFLYPNYFHCLGPSPSLEFEKLLYSIILYEIIDSLIT